LENLIQRSVILSSNSTLSVSPPEKMTSAIDAAAVVGNLEEQKRIVEILQETKGRISGPNGAACRLGVKRSTLLDRMKKLGIDAREVRTLCLRSRTSVRETVSTGSGSDLGQ
jgi:transcriptional regulator of acetoin/glycerol metabolism